MRLQGAVGWIWGDMGQSVLALTVPLEWVLPTSHPPTGTWHASPTATTDPIGGCWKKTYPKIWGSGCWEAMPTIPMFPVCSTRSYTVPDPPGLFDGHVWPMYLKHRKEMEDNGVDVGAWPHSLPLGVLRSLSPPTRTV